VEVATFRASPANHEETNPHLVHSEAGIILRDNVYGMLEDDVFRRDFTINALYYNIADFTLIDYVGGLKDLKTSCLRMIGNPSARYREDPVRMLRAIRFAAKLDFRIAPDTEKPIFELGYLVAHVPSTRLLDEYDKLFLSGFAQVSFQLLRRYKLFAVLFPQIDQCLSGAQGPQAERFIKGALADTDKRVFEHKPVALPFLLAAFFWYPLQEQVAQLKKEDMSELAVFYEACDLTLQQQQKNIAISKRLIQGIREIWILQGRLTKRTGKRPLQLCAHPKFRAAYDFLLLRAMTEDKMVQELAQWWQEYITGNDEAKAQMTKTLKKERPRYRRKPKKRL
jgi:poly(A) polymerase